MKHFDAFAGIGGFSLAFKNIFGSNYENVGFSEINKYATACYSYNFPKHKNYGDITTIRPADIGAIDIITAGFPCQAFSIAGKRRGFEDARGALFFEIARICSVAKPKYILLENVKGLLNHDGGRTISIIYQTLTDIGYTVEFQVVNTKWFLPQNRERIYLVGHLAGRSRPGVFPIGEEIKLDNQRTADKQVASCLQGAGGHIANGEYKGMNLIQVGTFRMHNDDKGFRETKSEVCPTIPARARQDGSGQPVIQQLPRGKNKGNDLDVCPTISSNSFQENNFVSGIRRLTEIECERLQGFPDDWTKYGNYNDTIKEIAKIQRYKMLGNAVSIPVVEEIARRLKVIF